jgi:hypothetical protein
MFTRPFHTSYRPRLNAAGNVENAAKTSHHGQDQHSVVIAHPATIIIMEDIQALM